MGKAAKNQFITDEPGPKQKKQGQGKWWQLNPAGDERYAKIGGLFCFGLAAFLLLAFTSFLFSWQVDHSLVKNFGWADFKNAHPEMAENWMGILGAWVAHMFIYRWFGIASYLFVLLLVLKGYQLLFSQELLPLKKTLASSLFFLFWFSIGFGFIFQESLGFLGGGFGYQAQYWLQGVLGFVGIIIFLLLTLLSYLVIAFNIPLTLVLPPFMARWLNFQSFNQEESNSASSDDDQEVEMDVPLAETEESPDNLSTEENEPGVHAEDLEEFEEGKGAEVPEAQEEDDLTSGIQLKNETSQPETPPEDQTNEAPQNAEKSEAEDDGLDLEIEAPTGNEEPEPHDVEIEHTEYDPTLDLSQYEFPRLNLLNDYEEGEAQVDEEELEERKNLIINTLKNYKIEIDKIKATVGPTVTLYEIVPAPGVRISKIKNLEDDIALSLAALGIRIIAPIPGKGTIGIEVPNSKPRMVSMKSVLASKEFRESKMELPVALGKTISNEVFLTDLTKMPHLLMAGATGQGKSVGLNVMLTSLLYKKHPSQVKFVLVDPKKVELSLFQKIKNHFLATLPNNDEPIITDTDDVINTLNSLCQEMDQRYDLLKDAQVRNIAEYNKKFINRKLNPEKGHRYLPYIVLVIDEMADLMMTSGKEVEMPVARLAQLARAIGIHLILATQRPSVNIITGVIKANFPARMAFRVTSKVDSRTILDSGGADQLIGKGDMLFTSGGDLIRLQCAFLDTDEVETVTDFIGRQQSYNSPMLLPEVTSDEGGEKSSEEVLKDLDPMFEEAARVIVQNQQGSTSLIQRRLKLGYNRAGRIVDQLEAAGVLGPFEGSKSRDVLIDDEYSLEQFLSNLKDQQ